MACSWEHGPGGHQSAGEAVLPYSQPHGVHWGPPDEQVWEVRGG